MNYIQYRPLLTFSLLLALFVITSGQTNSPAIQPNQDPTLSSEEKLLLEGSRQAILRTGITPTYFSKHFRVQQVVNKTGDRRVVWKFSINEYDTIIVDSIGYYTEGGKRVNVHGVESLLLATSDIKRTIPKARALKIMKSCLGAFANPVVEYKADGSRKAVLVLNAHSIPKSDSPSPSATPESKKTEASPEQKDHDRIREGRQKPRPPIELGSVNLETGKCVKGIGQAGAPKPPI
ncbi:MAG TPA: hypothetical protein VFR80_12040 [Pyrinomonadaceae bacterium]|nr:hypothetical protein [Pyrinomonadaceae bacterium]